MSIQDTDLADDNESISNSTTLMNLNHRQSSTLPGFGRLNSRLDSKAILKLQEESSNCLNGERIDEVSVFSIH
jgi:hypothetical protein